MAAEVRAKASISAIWLATTLGVTPSPMPRSPDVPPPNFASTTCAFAGGKCAERAKHARLGVAAIAPSRVNGVTGHELDVEKIGNRDKHTRLGPMRPLADFLKGRTAAFFGATLHMWGVVAAAFMSSWITGWSFASVILLAMAALLGTHASEEYTGLQIKRAALRRYVSPSDTVVAAKVDGEDAVVGVSFGAAGSGVETTGSVSDMLPKSIIPWRNVAPTTMATLKQSGTEVAMLKLPNEIQIGRPGGGGSFAVKYVTQRTLPQSSQPPKSKRPGTMVAPLSFWGEHTALRYTKSAAGVGCALVDPPAPRTGQPLQAHVLHDRESLVPHFVLQAGHAVYALKAGAKSRVKTLGSSALPAMLVASAGKAESTAASVVEELSRTYVISPHTEQALHYATSVREVDLGQGGTLTLRQSKSGHIEAHVGARMGISAMPWDFVRLAAVSACSITCLCATALAA